MMKKPYQVFQRRKLVRSDLGDEVVGQRQRLEPLVSGEGLRLDLRDVVVGQVQLHHDLQVPEGVRVNFLKQVRLTRVTGLGFT